MNDDIVVFSPVQESPVDRALAYIKDNVSALTFDNYMPSIRAFLAWAYDEYQNAGTTHPAAVIAAYKGRLLGTGLDKKTVNKHLSAIRAFFKAQATLGIISSETYQAVESVPNYKVQGRKYGVRLSIEQAHALINAPSRETLTGRRDRAVLAFLLGCGLRRSEIVGLTWGQIYKEGSVWLIRNLVGKHNRVRTVSVPVWVKRILDEYSDSGKQTERVFRSYKQGTARKTLTAQTIYNIVKQYDDVVGIELAPHDLRRTYASIARLTAGVEGMTQIQRQLGHASLSTTEHYIGEEDDFELAAGFIPDLDIME